MVTSRSIVRTRNCKQVGRRTRPWTACWVVQMLLGISAASAGKNRNDRCTEMEVLTLCPTFYYRSSLMAAAWTMAHDRSIMAYGRSIMAYGRNIMVYGRIMASVTSELSELLW